MVSKKGGKMLKSEISGDIQLGDLIVVGVYGNCLNVGIYIGRGQGNSVQFYNLKRFNYWLREGKKPYVDYICGQGMEHRVMKMSRECLSDSLKKQYDEASEFLKTQK